MNEDIVFQWLTNGDVPGGTEDEVDQHRVEGGVEAVHRAQGGQEGVGHAWETEITNTDTFTAGIVRLSWLSSLERVEQIHPHDLIHVTLCLYEKILHISNVTSASDPNIRRPEKPGIRPHPLWFHPP